MIIKQDHTTSSSANACGNCGVEERRLLHHVRHRGIFRRLCSTCVLRLHPQSFCPSCFQVYPPSPPHDSIITCSKCYSSSHSYCVASPASPGNHYICPLCVNPNSPIFNLKKETEANVIGEGESLDVSGNSEVYRVIDKTAAKTLLAAAKIAAASMSKAAVAARVEAERRAKEAAFTRKRAREALEHVAYLVVREKVRKKESALSISPPVSRLSAGENVPHLGGGGGSGGNMDDLGVGIGHATREKCTNVNNGSGARSENADGGVNPVAVVEEKTSSTGNVDGLDNSSRELAALDIVELRGNEKMGGTKASDEVSGKISNDNCVQMDVEKNGDIRVSSGSNDGKNNVGGGEMSADLGSAAENHKLRGENMEEVIEGMVLVPRVEDQMQHKENYEGQHNNGTQQ
ncbi:uncharacterized protein LOC111411774 [Olea europaea subsp. europaea]|uniref:Uncharacterized protein LOC111411774 n=1 Tax=Olea europaea subsp. europaea TaxID=158383 RepID=A0A8S0PXU3_OLEEU|nr:uncharacterized protein LOC111411774 [Olea europaea subsp. europaea]